jgi:O-antigen/teichoic acid export membrane protein
MPQKYITPFSLKAHLLSGSAWSFGGKLMSAFMGITTNVLIARLLTPEEMGIYFLIFSFVSVATVLAQLGLNQAVVRLVAESLAINDLGRVRATINIAFRYAILVATIVAVILITNAQKIVEISIFNSSISSVILRLAAIWIVVLTVQNLQAETFRGFHKIHLATLFGGLISSILPTVLLISIWLNHNTIQLAQILSIYIASGIASIILAGSILLRNMSKLKGQSYLNDFKVIKISLPFLINNLVFLFLTQANIWIINIYFSSKEVAIYGSVARLVSFVIQPLLIINAVVPPLIADLYTQGKKSELERTLRITATVAGIPALSVLFIFIFFGDTILKLLYGSFYHAGSTTLVMLSIGQIINAWAGSCGLTLMMTGHQVLMMQITLVSGGITVMLSLSLVGYYGIVGVATAAAVGLIIQNICMWLGAKLTTGMWTHFDINQLTHLIKRLNIKE